MVETILQLAQVYTSTVKLYDHLIRQGFLRDGKNFGQRLSKHRVGTFRSMNGYYYSFHGIGCAIVSGDPEQELDDRLIVDWDYHEKGLCYFRQDFFKVFISENYPDLFVELGGETGINDAIKSAIASNLIVSGENLGDRRFLKVPEPQ